MFVMKTLKTMKMTVMKRLETMMTVLKSLQTMMNCPEEAADDDDDCHDDTEDDDTFIDDAVQRLAVPVPEQARLRDIADQHGAAQACHL